MKYQRGAVLVEFAIAVWTFLLLLIGIIDLGRAVYTYHLVSNAARLGTRYAIVRGSNCSVSGCPTTSGNVQTYVRSVSPGVDTTQLNVTTTWPGPASCSNLTAATNGPGCPVQVVASYAFTFLFPFIPSMTMTSTSRMVISQ